MAQSGARGVSKETRGKLIGEARRMRKEPTEAEAFMWSRLRRRQLGGYKFRRQHVVEAFIVDFYCAEARLVVEIDGPVHRAQSTEDVERECRLQALGFEVLRFRNEKVLERSEEVLAEILHECGRAN